ncbi:MAG: ABC transporter substrate-binding protein [Klebsiella pneumoniae]|nr:ABC transporter substrate-binding protein [Klebsiella pneumoniae]
MNTRLTPVFTLLTVAALATSASCFAAEKFTFLTNWYAQAEHGGFYQAQATGLYQHAGLDVEIKMGGPQINVMQLMAAGQADCTLGDNGQALETWQAGVHAVTVATVFQHSPTVFITHDKVENPAELKDKTFLLATEAYTSFWPWAKSELGLAGSKVRPYTFNVQPFLADKNLVQQGYVTSEPFSVQLVTGGDAKTGGIGIITEPRLKKTWDMLVKNKLIDASKVPFEQTYTLEMVKDAGVMP